jgi:hypothetical protein
MFYLFFLGGDVGFDGLQHIAAELLGSDCSLKSSHEELEASADGFGLFLTVGGDGVRFRSEDHKLGFRFQMWFDIYGDAPNGIRDMMVFIGHIMRRLEGDCLLESNGDTPILLRRNRITIVDDSRLQGTQRFPFEELGIVYQEGAIR